MAPEREKGEENTVREWKDRSRELAELKKNNRCHHFCRLKLVSLWDAEVAMEHKDIFFSLTAS